ncbi:MAG: GldG family protein [Oscillospiraceae bacterium]|nr:GldG family protein [Oscillospiraceae bacterium]
MQRFFHFQKENTVAVSPVALQGGAYSLTVTAVVLAILVMVNLLVSLLPPALTKLDISASKLYSITSNTKTVVNSLDRDVTIYWIVQADKEDSVLENLLNKYDSLSEHIKVEKKNPDTFPTFAEKYTKKEVKNNSLVVECGEKNRYISIDDIYIGDVNYATYTRTYSFDGEGAITSAIDYVVSEKLPKIYVLEGHGEAELPAFFAAQMEKDNMERESFSLLNRDGIPSDAGCVLIYAPSTDISEKEQEILSTYLADGGKLMVLAGPSRTGTLKNLYGLLNAYGLSAAEGIVVEGSRDHYAFQMPYIMLPDIQSNVITDPLIQEKYRVIVPLALGLKMESADSATVAALLKSSGQSFSKAGGYEITSYEKEEGDADGPFVLAASVETKSGGKLVWISSSGLLDEQINAYSSGANLNFVMNSIASLLGEREAVAIRSKSLNYNYLTINDTAATMMKTFMIGVIPLLFVAMGISETVDRGKKKQ